jgi:hypothetical protein
VANFIKRLNKGTNGRYRGKIPLICFNCDGIGHFANKCPHKKKRNDEGYSKGKHTYKGKELQRKISRKAYASKKTSHQQMNMKSVTVRHEEFYSWK